MIDAQQEPHQSFTVSLKSILKRIPLLVTAKRRLWPSGGIEPPEPLKHDVLATFPLYTPYSDGRPEARAALTVLAINRVFDSLGALSAAVGGRPIQLLRIEDFPQTPDELLAVDELKTYFDEHGSDKGDRNHNYHYLYGVILKNRHDIACVLEIGIGTNHSDVVSNMGKDGTPGASLRAFRTFLPRARIYGADVDRRVLFAEDRIETFFVDQTDPLSFDALSEAVPSEIDLIIDDGLHSPYANIETLRFGMSKVKVGGWVVIEDIRKEALPVWQTVAALLPTSWKSHLFTFEWQLVFAVQRLR